MTDESFYDDDKEALAVPVAKAVSASICQVTVLAVPPAERTQVLGGFAKRLLESAETVMAASFGENLIDFAKKNGVSNVVSLSTYRKLSSKDEQALFDLTSEEIAKTALMLGDIQVSGGEIGSCWALGLRAPIFRELYGVYTIGKILEQGVSRLVILIPGMGASEYALIARLLEMQADGKVNLRGVSELKDGAMKHVSCAPVYAAKQKLAARNQSQDLSVTPASRERLVGLHEAILGKRPSTADVLFLHMTDSPIFQRNIGAIIDQVKEQKGVPAVLVVGGDATEIYEDKLERDKIYKFNPKVKWDNLNMLKRLQDQIATRVEVACLDVTPLSTWTPLLAATDKNLMFAALKKLLIFRSAVNLMTGFVKPRSVYITQSPATNAYAYMAMSSVGDYCNCFYSFSSLLTEGAHALPFIAPAGLLAYGEQDTAIIRARSELAASAIRIVGTPSYDLMKEIDVKKVRKEVHEDLDLPNKGQNIALVTSRLDSDKEDVWLARFLRWAHTEDVNCILVKNRHAGSKSYEKLESMAKAKQWKRVRISEYDRIQTIAAADIVVTDQPETAVEAVLLDKVMVHARLSEKPEGRSDFIDGVGFEVSTEAALQDVISGILLDEDYIPSEMLKARQAFKNMVNGHDDGNAAQKVAQELLSEEKLEHVYDNPFTEFYILTPENSAIIAPVPSVKFN